MERTERIDRAAEEIRRLVGEFVEAAEDALETALRRRMEDLVERRAEWLRSLDDRALKALRATVADVIRKSAMETAGRLRDLDLWLEPSVLVGTDPDEMLDGGGNRAWIVLLNGARQLDGVLGEFGLDPTDVPDPGGGHYGLQPQSANDLDPSNRLQSLWQQYRRLYDEYRRALREPDEERERREREEARRRWSGG